MFNVKVRVENKKYCGSFDFDNAKQAASKVVNNVDTKHGFNSDAVKEVLRRMRLGDICGFNSNINSKDVAWVTKTK